VKIGEVARRLGTTVRTLRFYEEQGLVTPHRTPKGTRHYREEDVGRFATILELADLGFPLSELRTLAAIRPQSDSGDVASRRVHRRLSEMAAELETRRRRIETAEADLTRTVTAVQRCFGCSLPPTRSHCAGCDVAAELAASGVMRLVWDEPAT